MRRVVWLLLVAGCTTPPSPEPPPDDTIDLARRFEAADAIHERSDMATELDTLEALVALTKRDPSTLRWKGAPLPRPVEALVAHQLHRHVLGYAEIDHPAARAQAERIARLAAEAFPDDAVVHNDLAFLATRARRPADALAELEKAHALAPDDPLILANLAKTALALGDPRTRTYLEQLATRFADTPDGRLARRELERLSQ